MTHSPATRAKISASRRKREAERVDVEKPDRGRMTLREVLAIVRTGRMIATSMGNLYDEPIDAPPATIAHMIAVAVRYGADAGPVEAVRRRLRDLQWEVGVLDAVRVPPAAEGADEDDKEG